VSSLPTVGTAGPVGSFIMPLEISAASSREIGVIPDA
jgi:hypothetical protein